MRHILTALAILVPVSAFAQSPAPVHTPGMMHPLQVAKPAQAKQLPIEPGQSAFAAIQEIVAMLEADPSTDWSKGDIEALRQHLIDMDNVTLRAEVKGEPVEGGMRFAVSGEGAVKLSIRRMVSAYAATMDGVDGWHLRARETETGAVLTVTGPASGLAKIRALGFAGILTRGEHHHMHHLMMARGLPMGH